ncbi:GNAT family N-acetyltransferase [Chitinimonas sp.]|uniref:GNAT family N-acetyltransferase n=1 Tax=Chitinimonas sp. TaxID=1934313 RepID=UPI0035B35318
MALLLQRIVWPSRAQLNELHALCCKAPNYWLITEGKRMPGRDAIAAWFDGSELPVGRSIGDQHIFAILDGETLIGVAMALRGWRYPEQAQIGLLLIGEPWQGRGIGREAYQLLEREIASWPGMQTLRIGIIASNGPAFVFWRRMGFAETGERRRDISFLAETRFLEKRLPLPDTRSAAEIPIAGL